MTPLLDISVVIPTVDRRERLLALLRALVRSTHSVREVLVVDAGTQKLSGADLEALAPLPVRCLDAPRSVCVQRNAGIHAASSRWIFLCDDDIEVPADHLARLAAHAALHPEAGALSGLVLEDHGRGWTGEFPETSSAVVVWKHLFQLGMWGAIRARRPPARWIAERCQRRGNHISKAGWPVITQMDGPYFRTPIYALGASLIRRDWLLASPFDEILDSHGLGDNYGVAIGFPPEGIHVLTDAPVRHHRAPENRLPDGLAREQRLLALDYFIRSRRQFAGVSRRWFLWSLVGGAVMHSLSGNTSVARSYRRALLRAASGDNPYLRVSATRKSA